jgi:hypothetical protein
MAETTVKRLLCCRFRHTGKSMLTEDMSRNKCFFQGQISSFTFYIHFWPIYWLSLVSLKTWGFHNIHTMVFCILTSFNLVGGYQHFRRTHCLQLQGINEPNWQNGWLCRSEKRWNMEARSRNHSQRWGKRNETSTGAWEPYSLKKASALEQERKAKDAKQTVRGAPVQHTEETLI